MERDGIGWVGFTYLTIAIILILLKSLRAVHFSVDRDTTSFHGNHSCHLGGDRVLRLSWDDDEGRWHWW